MYVYIRHDGNSWRFECGQAVSAKGWQRADEPAWPAEDRAFYRQHSLAAGALGPDITLSRPPCPSPGFPSLPAAPSRRITTIER